LTKENGKSNLPPAAGQQEARKLTAIEKRSAQILVLFFLASLWFQSWAVSLGIILGGGIALLNFRWLWRILSEYIFAGKRYSLFQLVGKFFVLLLVIFLVIRYVQVNPVAFVTGISALVFGIVIEAVRQSLRTHRKGAW
jgi:ABC-type multidrug transport system fused ATPase/permease subunit